jgi:hypothetical protein
MSLLLSKIIIITIIMTATIGISSGSIINSNPLAYAHNFAPSVSASFLTKINQIKVESQLVESNLLSNTSLAKQHAEIASQLFENSTKNDLYYNAEGNNGLAKKVSEDISLTLNNLQKAMASISKQSQPLPQTQTSGTAINQIKAMASISKQSQPLPQTQTSGTAINQIKAMVNNINDILDKAVSVRIDKYDLTNSTVHALVLADIAEKAYNDYSYAFGIKPVNFSATNAASTKGSSSMMNMMGMGMMMSSPNVSSNNSSNGSNTTSNSHSTMTNNNTLVNATDYERAQALAIKAEEIFNNDLKPISSATNASSAISKIENDVIHLKHEIDNKAPVMDIMKIVHMDIHPTLLTVYNLKLKYY